MQPRANARRIGRGVGQRGHELELRGTQLLGQPEIGRRACQPGDRQRFRFGPRDACQLRAISIEQGEAAARPAIRIHGHARRAQLVDIAIHGADRHVEFVGERLRGHTAFHLEHQQHRNESARRQFLRSF
jgi:hypothetical protein